ncbi:prenyltransferase/squalene oxidase repeat-containing protein [Streptomyces sp. NPDC056069]|uniref:prenyltransferase/squalene oxidase repeat-containing protein n=1 Tax=Streptomyces sp. NPDC056069 TaxID=3345702 RepID=UPI0035DB0A9A
MDTIVEREIEAASGAALKHLVSIQNSDGSWEGEVVTNTTLLSQYVLTKRIVGSWPLKKKDRAAVRVQFQESQLEDGSWPMHPDGEGRLFPTVLAYVALRLLGTPPTDEMSSRARKFIRSSPNGALSTPSWGKFWLAMLGVHEYSGMRPIAPETILLPTWLPVHPDRFFPQVRYIYYGMAYLYSRKFRIDLGGLGNELREELYLNAYGELSFPEHRDDCAAGDAVTPPPGAWLRMALHASELLERCHPARSRSRAQQRCLRRLEAEIVASNGVGLSPLHGLLTCVVLSCDGKRPDLLHHAVQSLEYWRWYDPQQGLRISGTRSRTWDTAFALRALASSPPTSLLRKSAEDASSWILQAQLQSELPAHLSLGRDRILGGWSFTEGIDQWPVSDCTAEAISAILESSELHGRIDPGLLWSGIEFILSRRNRDGGFGAFERSRAPAFIEVLNPSQMYVDCMRERSFTDCTASCVGALARFHQHYPDAHPRKVTKAIHSGIRLLRQRQQRDGGFPAFWGINYTYAGFLVTEALTASGLTREDPTLHRLTAWFLRTQKADGGWGEHYSGCLTDTYTEHPKSQAVMTAWAVLALLSLLGHQHPAVLRGVDRLVALRGEEGWPQQAPAGSVFRSGIIDYRLYKDIFPAWALATYARAAASSK